MKTATKLLLIISTLLILIGSLTFVIAMSILNWDFSKISTSKYLTNEHSVTEDFDDISIESATADIEFLPSKDSKCSVVCYEKKNLIHEVSVKDGVLSVKLNDTRKWYHHIGIDFKSPKITVYLPKTEYESLVISSKTGDVEIPDDFKFECIDITNKTGDITCSASAFGKIKIKATTADITLRGLSAASIDISVTTGDINASKISCEGELKLSVSTGDVSLSDIVCKSLVSTGDTGDMTVKDTSVSGKISIERDTGKVSLASTEAKTLKIETDTGDVRLSGSDASDIYITTDTGDVEGSLLTEKVFITRTDTGSVSVPSSTSGGRCEITTDTGDIKITIK